MAENEAGFVGPTDRRSAWIRRACGAVLVAGLAIVATVRQGRTPKVVLLDSAERRVAPAFFLPLLSGGNWQSQQHRGNVVVVNLWATWCLPCRRELPVLSALAQADGPDGLDVLGVVQDEGDRRAKAESFLRGSPVAYPTAVPEQMPQMGSATGVVPTTVLIDREGRVAAILAGAFDEGSLRSAVAQLLRER